MPENPTTGESPEDDQQGVAHGEEGTISRDELESENTKRSVFYIEAKDEAQVTIRTDGGSTGFFRNLLTHYDEINHLLTKVIILVGLVVLGLLLWRIGLFGHLVRLSGL